MWTETGHIAPLRGGQRNPVRDVEIAMLSALTAVTSIRRPNGVLAFLWPNRKPAMSYILQVYSEIRAVFLRIWHGRTLSRFSLYASVRSGVDL